MGTPWVGWQRERGIACDAALGWSYNTASLAREIKTAYL